MRSHTSLDGAAAIHFALENARSDAGQLLNKTEYSLQLSIGKITYRSKDFTSFKVQIIDNTYDATLFFHPKFYALNGYPKLGEYVVIIHNNGNNAHIMYSANPKDITNPPYGGIFSKKAGVMSSAKCSL